MGVFETNGDVADTKAYQLEMIGHARQQTALLEAMHGMIKHKYETEDKVVFYYDYKVNLRKEMDNAGTSAESFSPFRGRGR